MFVVNTSRYNFSSLLLYIAVIGITSKFYFDITKFNKQPKAFDKVECLRKLNMCAEIYTTSYLL